MDYNLVSEKLITYLEEMFPNVLPPRGTDTQELSYLQGQQSVIDRLKQLYEDDNVHGIGS